LLGLIAASRAARSPNGASRRATQHARAGDPAAPGDPPAPGSDPPAPPSDPEDDGDPLGALQNAPANPARGRLSK
jgi:hypothetical protein